MWPAPLGRLDSVLHKDLVHKFIILRWRLDLNHKRQRNLVHLPLLFRCLFLMRDESHNNEGDLPELALSCANRRREFYSLCWGSSFLK